MTSKYIGVKLVTAYEQEKDGKEGYGVIYPDGYSSWCPKETLEKANIKLANSNNTISQEDVDKFIACYKDYKLGDKTTVVQATLVNGFTIVESSSCVDPANFNQEIGIDICLNKIKDKIWFLLGFLLQTGVKGVK
jgi:hypothetical protein